MALSSTRVSTVIAAKPIASVTLTGSCMMVPAQAMLTATSNPATRSQAIRNANRPRIWWLRLMGTMPFIQ